MEPRTPTRTRRRRVAAVAFLMKLLVRHRKTRRNKRQAQELRAHASIRLSRTLRMLVQIRHAPHQSTLSFSSQEGRSTSYRQRRKPSRRLLSSLARSSHCTRMRSSILISQAQKERAVRSRSSTWQKYNRRQRSLGRVPTFSRGSRRSSYSTTPGHHPWLKRRLLLCSQIAT